MPRDGSGIYTQPLPDVVPATTIASTVYNGFVNDVETDLNQPRPLIAGGTGGNSAAAARANIQAELAFVQVTNYDTQVWEAGSFFSAPGATSAPVAGHGFVGTCIGKTSGGVYIQLEAYDIGDAVTPHTKWVRQFNGATWSSWAVADSGLYVAKAGDTMSGDLTIAKSNPSFALNATATTDQNVIFGNKTSLSRWSVVLGNTTAESSTSTGSDFVIARYNNAGGFMSPVPFQISRATGGVTNNFGTDWGSGPMRLKYSVGSNLLQWDKDLNNVDRTIWELGSCPAAGATNGYQKLGSGIIFQWGVGTPTAGDLTVNFPVTFPSACLNATATMLGGSQPATTGIGTHVVSFNTVGLVMQARYFLNGGSVGAGTQSIYWHAIGV